jgi:hypothetical protein
VSETGYDIMKLPRAEEEKKKVISRNYNDHVCGVCEEVVNAMLPVV